MRRCAHCEVPADVRCVAAIHPRVCRLIDPASPDYNPDYKGQVMLASRAVAGMAKTVADRPKLARLSRGTGPVRTSILTPCLSVGGVERWMITLMKYIDRNIIDFVGVGITDRAFVRPEVAREVEALAPLFWGDRECKRMAKHSEVVMTWGIADSGKYLPTARKDRPKLVATSHGDGHSVFTATVMAATAPIADSVVAVAPAALGPIPPAHQARAVVIPNGIDYARLTASQSRSAVRVHWGLPPRCRILGYIGRVSWEKDVEAVARAVSRLPDPWRGVVVGEGPGLAKCVRHAERIAGARVHFAGVTQDIGSALRAFDVTLMPSRQEGFCLSLVEAWGAGVPAVATRVGVALDHPELVYPVRRGASAADLARAVAAAWADEDGRRERTRAARKVARSLYAAPVMARKWTELLWGLCRSEPVPTIRCPVC